MTVSSAADTTTRPVGPSALRPGPAAAPARSARYSRIHAAVFSSVGDEGRVALVEQRIAHAIAAGILTTGERLPSESELAQSFGVAPVTVREALGALRARRLVETRRGRNGGSFVSVSAGDSARRNAAMLLAMSRVALNDLALHYRTIAVGCAELACRRATPDEVALLLDVAAAHRDDEPAPWRRAVTDVQLELAALSQSARLTREHVKVQSELMPLTSLYDVDTAARAAQHELLVAQIDATRRHDVTGAKAAIGASVDALVRWLIAHRRELQDEPVTAGAR